MEEIPRRASSGLGTVVGFLEVGDPARKKVQWGRIEQEAPCDIRQLLNPIPERQICCRR